jgi:hypothetical protein
MRSIGFRPRNFHPLALLLKFACAILLTACTGNQDFSTWVAGYNRSYGESQDKMLLLNIVRSAYRMPTYYSGVVSVLGNGQATASATGSANLARPNPPTGLPGGTFGGTLTVTSGFSVNVTAVNTAEFVNGLLNAANINRVNYYIEKGVAPELIFNLLIDSITINDGKGRVDIYFNDPTNPDFPRFQRALNIMLDLGLTTETVSATTPLGPPLTMTQVTQLQRLVGVALQGGALLMPTANGDLQMQQATPLSRFCFLGSGTAELPIPDKIRCQLGREMDFGSERDAANAATTGQQVLGTIGGTGALAGATVSIKTRSVDGVFTYLGKLVWMQTVKGVPAPVVMRTEAARVLNYTSNDNRLFVVRKNQASGDDIATVRFGDDVYSVVNTGESAAVMTILSQLFSLSQSVKALPQTSTVLVQ